MVWEHGPVSFSSELAFAEAGPARLAKRLASHAVRADAEIGLLALGFPAYGSVHGFPVIVPVRPR